MAMQVFTGRVMGEPKQLITTNTHRTVVHVNVSFIPDVKLDGTLPELKDDTVSTIQLSFWNEDFQERIMKDPKKLVGKMITGYCDNVVQRDQFYNGTGHVFVLDPKGTVNAPQLQVIHAPTSAPKAPVAPVAP